MRCPFCSHSDDSVLDSRPVDSASVIRRRRECHSCQKRFTTYERLEEMPLMVVKSDDRREPFDRNKLRQGLLKACEKRPISIDAIDLIVDEIEYELKDYVMEISSRVIGEKILKKLAPVDQMAYIRFASVHKNFSNIDSFLGEIKQLKRRNKKIAEGALRPRKINLKIKGAGGRETGARSTPQKLFKNLVPAGRKSAELKTPVLSKEGGLL